MKILFLSKRQYTGKDLLDDRYGRFWEIPYGLSQLGHEIKGFCLSYKNKDENQSVIGSTSDKSSVWTSINAGPIIVPGIINYLNKADKIIKEFDPDILVCFSDSLYAIFGEYLAKINNKKLVIDLSDNFESFAWAKFPFIIPLFYRSLNRAHAITTNCDELAKKIRVENNISVHIQTVQNGINPDIFYKRDKFESRKILGLPTDATIIGTAGAISHSRGIGLLFAGFKKLKKEFRNLHLLLSGPLGSNVKIPEEDDIHYLGQLPLEKVPIVLSSMDLSFIINKDSSFSRYAFPQKTYEIIASQTPLLASRVGAIGKLLKDHPAHLYEVENTNDFIVKARSLLNKPKLIDLPILTWETLAEQFEKTLLKVIHETTDN